MSAESFRRHARVRVDAEIHRICTSLVRRPAVRAAFLRLVRVARGRVPAPALRNLAGFHHAFARPPETWTCAGGHPLAVVHALATHLFAGYPTPRFLAAAWFGRDGRVGRARRRWCVEVAALGGSVALADAIVATRLGRAFDHGAFWRTAIASLARRERDGVLPLARVAPIVEYVHAIRHHRARVVTASGTAWRASPVRGFAYEVDDRVRWSIVELTDRDQLAREGRAMRSCVAGYAWRCAAGASAIWSVRRCGITEGDAIRHGDGRPVLTIEVQPRTRTIVQLRAAANRRASGWPLALVRMWAAREGIAIADRAIVA